MSDHWATLRAGLLALFVAGLIWIWAEGESLVSRSLPRVQVQLPLDLTGELVLQPEDPSWTGAVQVRLEGPAREIEDAAPTFASGVQLPIPENADEAPDGRLTINLREALSRLPELAQLRGIIAETQPRDLNVRVLRMTNRELPIRVQLAREIALDGDPIATPATAIVRMPEGAANTLGDSARITAIIPEEVLLRLRSEGPQTLSVPLRLPADSPVDPSWVIIRPETTTVSLRPKQALDSIRLPNVPVWFSLPPTEDGAKWSVELADKFLTDVTVTGPSTEIARIRTGAAAVKAAVELSTDDLEKALGQNGAIVKQAAFVSLAPGVSATVANTTVRLKVSRR